MRHQRLINHHKIKKQLGRNVKKSKSLWSKLFGLSKKTRRDYSWKGKHANSFEKKAKNTEKKRIYTKIIIISLSIFITIGLVLYHPFFAINTIAISGLQRIEKQNMTDTINGFFGYKKMGILPQQSYFIADIKEIKNILKERYPIEHIVIEKQFPNYLNIRIEEKISNIIYDNSDVYSYIDLDGNIVEIMQKVGDFEWDEITEIVTSTNELGEEISETKIIERNHIPDVKNVITELGNYPLVYDMRHKQAEPQQNILESTKVKTIVDWYNQLSKTTDIEFKYIIIENDMGDIIIHTYERWYIKSRLSRSVDTQIGELQYLFREKIDREKLNYIDLRYADRVYWQ